MQKHFDELSALISPSSPAPSISTVSDSTMSSSPSASPTASSVSSASHSQSSSQTRAANQPTLPANHNATRVAAALAAAVNDPGKSKGRDRFPCTFDGCNLSFHRRYNLKVHFRKHTDEKPYACREPGCVKSFRWRSSAKHHMIHHGRKKAIRKSNPPRKSTPVPKPKPLYPDNVTQYSNAGLPILPKIIDSPMLPPMHLQMEDITAGPYIQHQPEPIEYEDFANLSTLNTRSHLSTYDPIYFANDFCAYFFAN